MFALKAALLVVCALAISPVHADGVDQENLDEYGTGIIEDYSDMRETEEIEWVWIAPQTKLSDYRFEVEPVENLTAIVDVDMEETFDASLPLTLERAGAREASAPLLHVDTAIFWANRANQSKMWIPYAGMHLAQAGVGIELVFRNDKGEIVAKVRQSGREGSDLVNATEEIIDDISRFVRSN